MRFGRLFWKLFLGNAVLMAAVLLTCIWLIVRQVDAFYLSELTRTLHSQAEMLQHIVADRFNLTHSAELNRLAVEIGDDDPAGIRVTFIAADGGVLGDSESNPAEMESHADRAEVRQALLNGWGEDTRWSHTLGRSMKYLAVRVGSVEAPAGVVRVAMALRVIGEHAGSVRRLMWSAGAAALIACILLALGLARLWSQPIRQITRTARSLSRGDLSARARVAGRDELAELARSLNEMRDHLVVQLETIDGQRCTLQSLLAQLKEGVVVTRGGRIALINPAAACLLGISEPLEQLVGRPVETCIAPHNLQRLLLERPETDENSVHELQIKVQGHSSRASVLVQASEITLGSDVVPRSQGAAGASPSAGVTERPQPGRLVVLTDVTPLARMLRVKADFAANASHELRTPLSAIRAAVETLSSIDPSKDEAAVRRCAEIIDRQSSRMDALVRDLLDLSRIESMPPQSAASDVALSALLSDLHGQYRERLEAKGLHWALEVTPDLGSVLVNASLLRLILDNLLDNAVKFTAPGGHIGVTAQPVDGPERRCARIEVADNGCGIPEGEQERVFERFYQVERARSGPDRGTGLGLSIVRHAVSALGGSVQLESKLGKGTIATLIIPLTTELSERRGTS